MHVGNLRTALYAYLIAKSQGGTFVLRIEDTDQARYVEGAVDVIYKTLAAAGLKHDEGPDKDGGYGPYIQSERKSLYKEYAEQLVKSGAAYYCFCDKDEPAENEDAEASASMGYDGRCRDLSPETIAANLAAAPVNTDAKETLAGAVARAVDYVSAGIANPLPVAGDRFIAHLHS